MRLFALLVLAALLCASGPATAHPHEQTPALAVIQQFTDPSAPVPQPAAARETPPEAVPLVILAVALILTAPLLLEIRQFRSRLHY
jgi:hypothetical protein